MSQSSFQSVVVLAVLGVGGYYAYKAFTGPVIDASVAERLGSFDASMRVNAVAFHNDPKVNKAWWDNQHKRRDGIFQSPPDF